MAHNRNEVEDISLSLKAHKLIKKALESCEDSYWTKVAETREKTVRHKAFTSHKKLWKRSKKAMPQQACPKATRP